MLPAYHEPPPSTLRRAPPLRRSNTTNSPGNSPPQARDAAPTRGIVTSSTAPLSTTNSVSPLYPLHPQSSLGPSLALPATTRNRSHSLRRPKDKDKDDNGKEKHHHRPHLHAHIPGHAYRHREKNFSVPHAAVLLGLPPEVDRIWASKDGRERQAELERMGFGAGLGTGLLGLGLGQDGSGFSSGPRKGHSRSVGGTPEGSRRGSLAREIEDEMQRRKKRKVTVEDVQKERQKGMKREEELRTSLNRLATLSTTLTRKLDYTYYSLLERVATLVSTIHSFRDLYAVTTTGSHQFHTISTTLITETTHAIDEFKNFESQGERIEQLENRLRKGREKADVLARRLDTVRERVDAWEKREGEWQKRSSFRLRCYVVGVCLLGGLILGVLFGHHLRIGEPGGRHFSGEKGTPFVNRSIELGRAAGVVRSGDFVVPEGTCGWMGRKGVTGLPLAADNEKEEKKGAWVPEKRQGEDERLRVFDEL